MKNHKASYGNIYCYLFIHFIHILCNILTKIYYVMSAVRRRQCDRQYNS